MLKRNPDVVALVLLASFLLVSAHKYATVQPVQQMMLVSQQDVKTRLHRTVASLKQCLHLRSSHRPTSRSL